MWMVCRRDVGWFRPELPPTTSEPNRGIGSANVKRASDVRRPRGRPPLRWIDTVRHDLSGVQLSVKDAMVHALNRRAWLHIVHRCVKLNWVTCDCVSIIIIGSKWRLILEAFSGRPTKWEKEQSVILRIWRRGTSIGRTSSRHRFAQPRNQSQSFRNKSDLQIPTFNFALWATWHANWPPERQRETRPALYRKDWSCRQVAITVDILTRLCSAIGRFGYT